MANKKVREHAISLVSYLEKVRDDDISTNQDVQRMFCWDNSAINELIMTVLTDDYIPPIILGEENLAEGLVQQYIVDGMQRSSALVLFRFGRYKVTSTVENSVIEYQVKKRDENNKVVKNEDGSVCWEPASFDIKNKTFSDLPKELQKKFDDYQIRLAIHQNCTMTQISKLVRRYNNHKSMNSSQKAFTYIDKFARKIRTISQNDFFKNSVESKDLNRKNGIYEKCVCESVMTVKYLDNWKKQAKDMTKFLNINAHDEDFDMVSDYLNRMSVVCEDRFINIFVPKDIAVWVAVFAEFSRYGVDDYKFAEFVGKINTDWRNKVVNGKTFYDMEKATNTKDKTLIKAKIELLTELLREYIGGDTLNKDEGSKDTLSFLRENISEDITEDDIELYKAVLDDCVKFDSPLYKVGENALVALVAYSCAIDRDKELEAWCAKHDNANINYSPSEKVNYTFLKRDFDKYLAENVA